MGRRLDDLVHREVEFARRKYVGQRAHGGLAAQLGLVHAGVDDDAHQSPLEFPDVRGHLPGDVVNHVGGNLDTAIFGVHFEDGDAGLEFRCLNVGD